MTRRTRQESRRSGPQGFGKDLLTVGAIPPQAVARLLESARALKAKHKRGAAGQPLRGKTLGLLFEKPSTRTRVSFQTGMHQLGGHSLLLEKEDIQLSRGETVADTAGVLSRYLDGLVIRTFDHAIAETWARHATIPVINGLTDLCHPCQALSDLLTIQERKKKLAGLKIAYIGDGNNVAHSLIEAAVKTGMTISLACPRGYTPDPAIVESARAEAARTGGAVEVVDNPQVAAKDADALYTDVWVSMGQEQEEAQRADIFKPYQINARLVKLAKPDAIVMHCLPAHRGQEITGDVLDGPQSVVLDQAENRLHMQKAILVELMGKRSK